ncbi:lysin A [Microbacterium phage PermaG]|nr:lysin A [Microbacterium phage PermaG]
MVDFKWWGNARVTPWMHYQLSCLDRDLRNLFGVGLVANSGIRLAQEQLDIWYARYTRTPNGRKVYDTRWWNGQLWYRISSAGTVAQPGTSNHEIQGSKAAVDIQDTGADAGITNKNSVRGRWIRANAWRYSLVASGDGFGEGWHFDITGIYNTPPGTPAGGGTAVPKEDGTMQSILSNGHKYGVDVEFITHYGNEDQASITRKVTSATDEQHTLSLADFTNLLDGLGIPRNVVDGIKGQVFNPQANNGKGAFEANGTWSRRREILAGQTRLESKLDALTKPAK